MSLDDRMKNILNRKTEDLEHDSPGVSWRCLAFFLSGDCFIILCMLIYLLVFLSEEEEIVEPGESQRGFTRHLVLSMRGVYVWNYIY